MSNTIVIYISMILQKRDFLLSYVLQHIQSNLFIHLQQNLYNMIIYTIGMVLQDYKGNA